MLTLKQQKDARFERREYFTPNARTAFFRILTSVAPKGTILLPAYIGINDREGSGVLDPVQKAGVAFEFYAVDEQLSPVMSDLEQKIAQSDVTSVLAIHYFGFPSTTFDQVVALCCAQNKFLIEDCAHALDSYHGKKRLGTFGDASFFSLHKLLAVENGGMLQINSNTMTHEFADDIDIYSLASYARADLERMRQVRRDNYRYLQSKLAGVKSFFTSLPDGVTPMNFPVLIEGKDRDDVYFALRDAGVPTSSLYHTLIPQIKESDYPQSYEVSRRISNLPIHQDITHDDIDRMIEILRTILTA